MLYRRLLGIMVCILCNFSCVSVPTLLLLGTRFVVVCDLAVSSVTSASSKMKTAATRAPVDRNLAL